MCGIVGQINRDSEIDRGNFISMRDALIHRGPDDSGVFYDGDKIALGHRRLAIIDLSETGRQPLSNEDGTVWITFNGEIYNYQELNEELKSHEFKSKTDTEVIIHAYEEWGLTKALEKFNGMFAFGLYDANSKKLYCVRDRVGVKPLVYYFDGNAFLFASEIKAVTASNQVEKRINRDAIYDYFIYRYVANPKTIYEDIWKLEPGSFLEFDIDNFCFEKKRYWFLSPERNLKVDEKQAIEEIQSLLTDSVRYRLIADVEVASFLSGGIDSSLITAIAKDLNSRIRAFSIDLQPPEYSEIEYATAVSNFLNIDFQKETVGEGEFNEHFERIIKFYDEPLADSSVIPTFLLCMFTSKHVKVALSGDGGDELFYGYKWYERYSELLKQKSKILTFLKRRTTRNPLELYRRVLYDRFSIEEVKNLFELENSKKNEYYLYMEKLGSNSLEPREANYLDFKTFLVDDILYKVDTASMANSLEVRTPYLDYRLVELLFKLDFELLFRNNELKHLLKEIAEKFIPKGNVHREKKGFSAPVMDWLKRNYREELLNGEMVKDGFINKQELKKFLEHEKNLGKIWQLYIFEKWYAFHYKAA